MMLSAAPVVGVSDREHWPQVFHHARDEHTSFVAAFCIKDSQRNRVQGRTFVEELQKLPFSDISQLSSALEKLCEKYKISLLSFSAMLADGGRAYLWSMNHGKIILKRGSRKGVVVESEPLKVVAGSILDGDMFLLGTKGIFDEIEQIADLDGSTAEELADRAAILLQKATRQSEAAAYILQYYGFADQGDKETSDAVLQKETMEDTDAVAAVAGSSMKAVRSFFTSGARMMNEQLSGTPSIRMRTPEFRKRTALVFGFVLCASTIALIIIWSMFQSKKREESITSELQPILQIIEQAKISQNSNPSVAREAARHAADQLQQKLNQVNPKSYEASRIRKSLEEAQAFFQEISGENNLDSLQLFYNFQLVKSAFLAKRASIEKNTAVFLDGEGSAIKLDVQTKQPSVVDLKGIKNASSVSLRDKQVFVLGENDVGEFGIYTDGKRVSSVLKKEERPDILRLFGTNAYVYFKETGDFQKLSAQGTGYGEGSSWFRTTQGLDKKTITSVAIDGRVWIGTSDGKIFVLAQGSKVSFSVTGMLQPFDSAITLFTSEDNDNIYVLEPNKQRVVILTKTGEYQKQFISKDLSTVSDMIVSPDGKTAFLVSGSVVYSLDLE
ncbi:MAG TPA: hypothetical protein VJ246_02095 [Patescibacteria group bacterium]|nr:hypothetical protein [Patescibacteria group bacterium]